MAAELKKYRERAGLTTREAAARIGISSASLNRSEMGRRAPNPEEVSALLAIYGVKGAEREKTLDLAREVSAQGWWEVGGVLPKHLPALANFESAATTIVHMAPMVVPGLLQTQGYSRAVISANEIPEADVEARVAARAARQTTLTRRSAPDYLAILDEATLRRAFGGPATMADQIRKLIDMANLPNVTILVIPFKHGGYALHGFFALMEFAKAPPIVYLEHKQASVFLHKPIDTGRFQKLVAKLPKIALGPAESVDFMALMAADHDRG